MAYGGNSFRNYRDPSQFGEVDCVKNNTFTKVQIWQKDASSSEHVRQEILPGTVHAGPSDHRISIHIQGMQPVMPCRSRNFLTCEPGSAEFDAVHTFSVIRMTLALYESDHLFNDPFQWNVHGNHQPIRVYPRRPQDPNKHIGLNAFYCREQKALLFYSAPSKMYEDTTVYACRSFDCVAHETGHAILDHLKPGWLSDELHPETGALHESFGDLTAIFLELSHIDQVKAVIRQTNGDLNAENFIAVFDEEMGYEFGRPNGARNANNDFKISQVGTEVHELSQVFTGAIYKIMSDIFDYEKTLPVLGSDSQILFHVSRDLRIHLLQAIKASPDDYATFSDVATQLLKNSSSQQHRSIMESQFHLREIFGRPGVQYLVSGNNIQMRNKCCHTMKRMSEKEREDINDKKRAGKQVSRKGRP